MFIRTIADISTTKKNPKNWLYPLIDKNTVIGIKNKNREYDILK